MKIKNPMSKYIEEWKKSKQSISSFCLSKGISKHKFDYWRIRKWQEQEKSILNSKKSKSPHTENFLPVKIKEDKSFHLEIKITSTGEIFLRIGESNDIS